MPRDWPRRDGRLKRTRLPLALGVRSSTSAGRPPFLRSQAEQPNLQSLFRPHSPYNTMSSHPADFSYPNYPAPVHPHNARDDDVKAPYDDLIDQYGSPYGAQPHKTFAVDPSALSSHARQPSYTVSNQSHETSKDLKSAYSQDPPDWEYPPPLAKEEKLIVEKKTTWSKVRLSFPCRYCPFP